MGRGRAARSSFAPRVRRSSGKSELSSHLAKCGQSPCLDVLLAFAKRVEDVLVLEDLQRLFESFLLIGGNQDGGRPAVSSDDDVLVPAPQFVEQLAELSPGLGERDRSCQNPVLTIETCEWGTDHQPASV
jgi:hypothetical protein